MNNSSLDPLFKPSSIVVIGASERKGSVGRAIMENLLGIDSKRKFHGKIYAVNIKGGTVFGLKCYRSVLEIDDKIDLAVIAIPAPSVPKVLDECGAKGVKGAIVISAGFSEVGEEGRKLEEELLKVARKWGIRVIGPNCLGIYSPVSNLDTIFNPSDRQGKPELGNIAFLSQSGALGAAFLDYCAKENLGLSYFVSYGNAADVDESDLLLYLSEDPHTKVICMYLEGVKNGRKFVRVASEVSLKKPIIIFKSGKTRYGEKAAKSHTGALSGNAKIFEAVAKKCGIILVDTIEELFEVAKAFSKIDLPMGKEIAIVTNGGGAGVIAADAVEEYGLVLKEFPENIKAALRKILPPHASVENPVDILGDAPVERYEKVIRVVLDAKPDAIIVIALLQSPAIDHLKFVRILTSIKMETNIPLLAVLPGGSLVLEISKQLEKHNIPVYSTPEKAVKVLMYMNKYATWQREKKKRILVHPIARK